MTVVINLLPASYREARKQRHRLRIGISVGLSLLLAELLIGLLLHTRASDTRKLLEETEQTLTAIEELHIEAAIPQRELALLNQQIDLATRLRTTHRWSRLLTLISAATPKRMVLTSILTDPDRWNKSLATQVPNALLSKITSPNAPKAMLNGIAMEGFAAEHDDLARFIEAIQGSGAFMNVNLTNARRDKFLENEAVRFNLECGWQ